jgi:hypothetical protein
MRSVVPVETVPPMQSTIALDSELHNEPTESKSA